MRTEDELQIQGRVARDGRRNNKRGKIVVVSCHHGQRHPRVDEPFGAQLGKIAPDEHRSLFCRPILAPDQQLKALVMRLLSTLNPVIGAFLPGLCAAGSAAARSGAPCKLALMSSWRI